MPTLTHRIVKWNLLWLILLLAFFIAAKVGLPHTNTLRTHINPANFPLAFQAAGIVGWVVLLVIAFLYITSQAWGEGITGAAITVMSALLSLELSRTTLQIHHLTDSRFLAILSTLLLAGLANHLFVKLIEATHAQVSSRGWLFLSLLFVQGGIVTAAMAGNSLGAGAFYGVLGSTTILQLLIVGVTDKVNP